MIFIVVVVMSLSAPQCTGCVVSCQASPHFNAPVYWGAEKLTAQSMSSSPAQSRTGCFRDASGVSSLYSNPFLHLQAYDWFYGRREPGVMGAGVCSTL